jgi:hypothetical protein
MVPHAPAPGGVGDPNQLGAAYARIGPSGRKATKVAVMVLAALLGEDEQVEAVVAGKVDGHPAVAALTDRAVVVADARQWRPFTRRLPIDPGLQVQGWQDDRAASLTLITHAGQVVVDQIVDRPLAVEMAQRIRYRTGATG